MNFNERLEEKITAVEAGLKEYLKDYLKEYLKKNLKENYPKIIYDAMSYSVMAGGKRLRPVLLLSACELAGGDLNNAMPFACAIEMIHTYSLIHDDLPAMDNDDLRRGKPTNHKMFGEAFAILAGDGLLNLAYEIMSEHCQNRLTQNNIKAMAIIAKSAGVYGMVGGQVADILYEDKPATEEVLAYIQSHKTGKLIQASLVSGAVLGGLSDEIISQFSTIGEKLGLAFQIKDDILDVSGNAKTLGKNTNCDEKRKKTTYVSFFGLEKAKEDYLSLSMEIINMIKSLETNNDFLSNLAKSLIDRDK